MGVLQAFSQKPKLLILDEPTSGLDPLMQIEFYKIVKEMKKEGTTIFMSSHVMPSSSHGLVVMLLKHLSNILPWRRDKLGNSSFL